jgi:hypothetical protein
MNSVNGVNSGEMNIGSAPSVNSEQPVVPIVNRATQNPMEPNTPKSKRPDLKLIGITTGVFFLFTILLVNTIGIFAGAMAFTFAKKDASKNELWIYGGIVAAYGAIRDFIKPGALLDARSVSVSVLSGIFMGLIAVGITSLCVFVASKLRK